MTPSEQSRIQRYQSYIRSLQAITAHHHPADLFHALTNDLRPSVEFDYLKLSFCHSLVDSQCLTNFEVPVRSSPLLPTDVPEEESIPAWVCRHQKPWILSALEQPPHFPKTIDRLRSAELLSLCVLPIKTVHRRLGVLTIGARRLDAYGPDELDVLSLVADTLALALDNSINFDTSQRTQDRLKLLLELANTAPSHLDLRSVLRTIAASVRRVMPCEGTVIALHEPETNELRVYAQDVDGRSAADRQSAFAKVFQTLERQDPRSIISASEGLQSLCVLPLIGRARTLGVLGVCRRSPNPFTQDDVDFLAEVASRVTASIENAVAYRQVIDLKERHAQENSYLQDEIRSESNFQEIIGTSAALRHVLKQVQLVASSDATVIIYGETGTGKELIARAVHTTSSRGSNAFVKLNCAAIPPGLLESELFGHERNAFTGALSQRIGRFEMANGGSLFLDEVGDIPLELQPKLLRVLQEREFERLGSVRTLKTDARLIAATNLDLADMVGQKTFRSDLFYRLNVFPIHVPPLRDRTEDIPLLVTSFVRHFSRRMNKNIETISSEIMSALVRYDWPGNIRELQNVIQRAVIVSTGPALSVPFAGMNPGAGITEAATDAPVLPPGIRGVLHQVEREEIVRALRQSNWVVSGPNGAAARLRMKRSTLQLRMRKLGISHSADPWLAP